MRLAIRDFGGGHVFLDATIVCEDNLTEAFQTGWPLDCPSAIAVGSRAIESVAAASLTRIFVDRVDCTACSADEGNTATVVGSTSNGTYFAHIDSRLETVDVVRDDSTTSPWPTPTSSEPPPIHRPTLDGAPPAVAARDPYPYCGRRSTDQAENDASIPICFLDAVLDGRPAEFIDHGFGTEGGSQTQLYRYPGTGPILVDVRTPSGWAAGSGYVILGAFPDRWAFSPLPVDLP